jgi:hypothetical protein
LLALAAPEDFLGVPDGDARFERKTGGIARDSLADDRAACRLPSRRAELRERRRRLLAVLRSSVIS